MAVERVLCLIMSDRGLAAGMGEHVITFQSLLIVNEALPEDPGWFAQMVVVNTLRRFS